MKENVLKSFFFKKNVLCHKKKEEKSSFSTGFL